MKSIKTTLAGCLVSSGVGMAQSDDPLIKVIGQVIIIVGPILLGYAAKDHDVTGGSRVLS